MGVSSWGGATDYINEAIERRKEEERREALRQAMERAQQERPRPAPEPLPNPWQRPVFSRPDIAVAQPPEPMQLSRPQVDTGTPMLGGGLSSPTVTSRVEQPQPQARPGQIAPRPMMQSLADRFNGPQPQQQSPWQPPSLPTPPQPQRATPDILRGEYNAPNRPMIPVPPRPMIGGQVEDKSLIAPERSAMGDAWQQYRNTPEYKYAQQKSQDRQGYTPPTFGEALENRTGEDDPYLSDYGVVGLSQALNRFPPTRELISRGQDMLQHVFEVPQMAALNAPIFGGSSASEVIAADAKTLMEFLAMTTLGKKYQPQGEQGIPAYLDQVRTQQLQRTRNERGAVAAAAETNPAAILALRNLPSDTVTPTLDLITNRDKYVANLKQEAAAIMAGDPVKAGELFLKAQELEGMSYADMVEANMNPWVELAYGLVDASDLIIPPIAGLFKLLPEMRALQKARKIINISEGAALANLAGAGQRGAKLTEAVAAGNKAARQVYSEIIAPFQGTGEKLATNKYLRWTLTQATDASRAAQDTKILHDGLVGVVGGFTSKADVMMILDNAINAPQNLVKGIVGLSEAPNQAVQWGRGLVANTPYAARQPILKTAENELLGMRSLQGDGLVNPVEFQAELDGIISTAARRMHGGKQPKTLPFGAQEAAIEITGANRGRVVYKDAKGNILQAGAETTVPNAQRQLDGILKDQSGKLQLHQVPYQIIKTFADVQKYIMNDVWLFGRAANWAGNALGASVMLYANDAYTPLPLRDIQNWTSMVYGGYQPSQRLANTLPNVTTSTRTMKDEVGGSAIGWLASKVTGTPDNKVTQTMKKLEEIPYGTTEIQLPGGQAIPVGEEAFAARAWYVPAKRVRDGELATSVTNDLGPSLETIESISPEWVESAKAKVVSLAQTGSKQDVMNGMRSWIGKPTITNTLQELGVPPELLLPHQAREIEQLLMDASPSEAGAVSQRLTQIFNDARIAPASSLTIDPGQVNVHWTDADMAQEAAWIADGQVEDAVKAGMDEATARTQAVEVTTGWLKEQQQTFERVLQDYAPVATNPQALGVVMDFYLDFMTAKGKVRKFVDELGQNARNVNTPEAWQGKWTATSNVYGSLRGDLGKMAEQTRLNLQSIYNGESYTPRYDWWETTKSYLSWDEEAFRAMRATDLGGIEDDAAKWQQVISGNREMFDNSQYELLGAYQAYPTLEGFDIVRSGLRRAETEGARIASELAILRKQRATGALSAEQYNKIRNAKWNQYFDDAAELNSALGKVIIRNGLAKQTLSELKWTENGTTWELLGPSTTPNKWRARNTTTNEAQEFTVGDATDVASPFTVPKNVVDDFNRLANNEAELDKAAEVAMQEIADNAPPVIRESRSDFQISANTNDNTNEIINENLRTPDLANPYVTMESAPERMPDEALPLPEAAPIPARGDDVEFMPNVKLPETPSTPIPTINDIRRIANEAGVATATKQGRPTDKHLVASLNKRLGIKVTKLDDLTDVQKLAAVEALKARGEEVISKMSPAEARKAIESPDAPSMKEYDFAVPSASHMFGLEDKGDGYNVFKRLFGSGKRAGNNTPPQTADVMRVTIENLNDVERTLKSRLPEILAGTPNTLTGAQKLAALDAVNDWLPNIDQINTISRMVGDKMAEHMMLNVNNRKDFDTLLSLMFPYHYFWSRMPSRLVTAALQKPSLVNFFYESKRAIDLENEQAGVPDRLRGTLPIPGTNARFNISAPLFRYMMGGAAAYLTPNPYVKDDPTDNQAEKIIKGWEKNGGPGVNLWLKFAADMADGTLDKNYSSTLNDLLPIPLVGAKASSVYQALSGQMPAKDGWAAKMGFGSSTTPDGFGLDTYGARRALGWIAEEEGIGDDLLGYANQVILNQYNGDPVEKDIDPAMLDEAMALAERGVKRAAQDAITGQVTGYTTTMAVKPWTEAEKAQTQASKVYNAAGYDPVTNPQGSKELQKAIIDANPSTTRGWAKSKDDPGIDAQISALYAEAEATGNWDVVMPKIEALKAQKTVDPTAPPADPTRGMNPTEVIAAEQKATAQTHWDAYMALEDNAEKAAYLRDNPDFAEIYKQNIIDKGETPENWWTNYGGKSTGKGGTALGGGVGPEPGSVVRADFTEAQLDQYYEEYLGFNDSKDWDGQKAWLLEHPDFARLEADRKYNKDGEYPWWYDDVLGGSGVQGAAGLQRPPSQPNSVADVLRRPYDAPGTGDNKGASGLGKTGKGGGTGTSVEADWSTEWDEYKKLGEDWDAKKQYMLDHPEFADYYKERYGSAWWLEDNSSSTYNRAYYGGGGGGGGGSPYLGGSSTSYHNARVDPRYMDRGLWEGPQMRPTIPYFNSNPEWLQAGRDLQPEPIRKWQRPQWR